LILPVFLLMTLGVVDLARVSSAYISLTNGVREAALFAAQGGNQNEWCTATSGKAATPAVSVPCPSPIPTPTTAYRSDDPVNIAYRIDQEASGMEASRIVLSPPTCDNGTCDSSSTTITIRATYTIPLITPLLKNVVGNSQGMLILGASTTAQILP
jgi:Flp pilus assembly protein TadG